ncbi:MAG: TIGR01244 family sulfur transferase [Congregibacter sp.]
MQDHLHHVKLTDTVAVSQQIHPEDMAAIAAAGFKVIVNNRPDGEAPDQPASDALQAAAQAAGLEYVYYPLSAFNYPGGDLPAMAALFGNAESPVFAFCRSGTRSANLWVSTQQASSQDASRHAIGQLGFDISWSLR